MSSRLDDATVRALVEARETDDYHPLLLDGTDAVIGAARVRALATEVLARRGMTCGGCRHWARITTDPNDIVRRGYGWCDRGLDIYCGWTHESDGCSAWQAREEGR